MLTGLGDGSGRPVVPHRQGASAAPALARSVQMPPVWCLFVNRLPALDRASRESHNFEATT
jgi:hypothetical protein